VSIILIWRDPESLKSLRIAAQPVYISMGALDAASATLGAIAGAYCPGAMQTILNQLIIPLTMIGSALFLNQTFDRNQVSGSIFILLGSVVASANYFFTPSTSDSGRIPRINSHFRVFTGHSVTSWISCTSRIRFSVFHLRYPLRTKQHL
jgi:drug/metabolite transporter (DMT)-like permease